MVKKYTHIFLPSICSYLHKGAPFFLAHFAIDIFYLAIFLLSHFIRFSSYLLQLVLPLFRSDMDGKIPVEDPEEYLRAVIRGDIPYVTEDAGEEHGEDGGEDGGEENGEDGGEEADVSSFLNLTGDGMEIVPTNNDDEGQTNIDGQVYIYIEPLVTRCIK